VTLERKRYVRLAAGIAALFVSCAGLTVLALPGSRQSFDYLIAGTFASAVTLCVMLGLFVKRHTARKSAPPS
jgi:hypothetical protein